MRERNCSFIIKQVDTEEVLKQIRNLKNSTATGVDYIDTKTIKLMADLVAPALTHIHFFFFIRTSKIQVRLPMFLGFWNFSLLYCS